MVKRILSFVGKEISGLHEAAYLLALSSFVSLLFALVRDRLLAHILGPGPMLDVYYAAFRVPDFIFVAVASLVSTSILVPMLIEARGKGASELRETIQSLFSSFLILIVIVCTVAMACMEPIMSALFPKLFESGQGGDLVLASRILLLSPILLGLSGFFASITQIQNRFLVYALGSPLYNVGIIFGIIFLLPRWGIQGLVWGVVLGALLLLLTQIPFVAYDGLLPRMKLALDWTRIKKMAKLSIPRTVTLSSQQLTTLCMVSFASFLGAGSISIFNLSLNLQSVPLALIGVSYSSAAFPVLAKLMADGKREAFLDKMIAAARHVIFWSVPISALFVVLRAQIVRTAFGSGQFSWSDTRLTAAALALFVVSVTGQGLLLLFVRSFYAEGKTAKPLLLNVISAVFTIALGFCLIKLYHSVSLFRDFTVILMKTEGSLDSSVLMLPLAFSLGVLLNICLHWRAFASEFPGFTRPVLRTVFHSVGASVLGAYVSYGSLRFFDDIFDVSTLFGIFFQGLGAGVVGMAAIILVLVALRSPELRDIQIAIRERVWKVDRSSLDKLPS